MSTSDPVAASSTMYDLVTDTSILSDSVWAAVIEINKCSLAIQRRCSPPDATIITPKIGEVVAFKSKSYPTEAWWKKYES